MKQEMKSYIPLFLLAVLPGCTRYYEWGKQHFVQAEKRPIVNNSVDPYVQRAIVYDQFQTVGMFDVLFYADPVRAHYEQQVQDRFGTLPGKAVTNLPTGGSRVQDTATDTKEAKELVFYVMLSIVDDLMHPLLSADNTEALWTPMLSVNGQLCRAALVKKVTLEPELKRFFGPIDDRYRVTYKVVFARFDDAGVDRSAQPLQLLLQSAQYKVAFAWSPEGIAQEMVEDMAADVRKMDRLPATEPESELSLID